jgi:hypothetical protein
MHAFLLFISLVGRIDCRNYFFLTNPLHSSGYLLLHKRRNEKVKDISSLTDEEQLDDLFEC